MDHSVVVHVHTVKGKGYPLAENDYYGVYHGVAPFDYREGIRSKESSMISWSEVVARHIEKWMYEDQDIVTITPAMISGSCLRHIFDTFPDRAFDVGIAEEHAMTFAAGLSNAQKKPFITIYSSFLQRAYDQINHDIARMQLPCLIGVDRSGLVGADGETHHGVFDMSILSSIPNLVIMTPKDAIELKMMINTVFRHFQHPYILRFPKGNIEDKDVSLDKEISIGSWEKIIFDSQNALTIMTYDVKVDRVAHWLMTEQLPVNLINARFIKPMDENILDELSQTHQHILVYETDLMIGSLGASIAHYYSRKKMPMTIDYIGIDDHYTPQGDLDTLFKIEHIHLDDLKQKVKEILDEEGKS